MEKINWGIGFFTSDCFLGLVSLEAPPSMVGAEGSQKFLILKLSRMLETVPYEHKVTSKIQWDKG